MQNLDFEKHGKESIISKSDFLGLIIFVSALSLGYIFGILGTNEKISEKIIVPEMKIFDKKDTIYIYKFENECGN